jgi:hypothetical protein
MIKFFKSIAIRSYINITFMNYIYNENIEQNLDLLRNEVLLLIDKNKNERSIFEFNIFKFIFKMRINIYEYTYSKYSIYLEPFKIVANIKNDDDAFVEEFKNKINACDNLFVLYLLYDFLNTQHLKYNNIMKLIK